MADARLLFPPGWQLTDSNDDPVSSGVIKFFDSGTSNPRTVYSDPELSTSLGTEVTTNSAGRPASGANEVLIYASEGDLTLQALTSASASLWSFDDVLGALDTGPFSAEVAIPDRPVLTKTDSYTVVDADRGSLINLNANSNPTTLTLPDASTVGDGWVLGVKNIHATATDVQIATVSSQTIDGSTSYPLQYQNKGVDLVSDAANWSVLAKAFSLGRVNLQRFTGNGTYVPSTGTQHVLVIATAGGGGGGSADGDGGSGAGGGGGEGGETAIKLWSRAELGDSAEVAVGAGGAAGSESAGGTGGNTTIDPEGTGTTLTVTGGAGGEEADATGDTDIALGGYGSADDGSGGDIHFPGAGGGNGYSVQSEGAPIAHGGVGGNSFWGGGAPAPIRVGTGSTAGTQATVRGAGGSGAVNVDSTENADGGPGFNGLAIFLEFIQ